MIMNQTKQPRRALSTFWAVAILILMCAFWQPGVAQAQDAWSTSGSNIYTNPSGNVGVGTQSPSNKLTVSQDSTLYGSDSGQFHIVGATNWLNRLALGYDTTGNYGWLQAATTGTAVRNLLLQPLGGNIGINTINPSNKLTVAQDTTLNGSDSGQFHIVGVTNPLSRLALGYDTNSNFAWIQAATSGTAVRNLSLQPAGGNIGIGTTTPQYPLSLQSNDYLGFEFGADSNRNFIQLYNRATLSHKPIEIITGATTGFYQDTSGRIGVGTTNPAEKFQVVGNISVVGNIVATGSVSATYQDVAEWVPARQQMAAGTVVILDPEKSNQVMSSITTYDTRVAGVVSAQPGVILGQGGEGKVMVATTGRVKVKVDATRSPIRIGDLLVTGDKEGVAMKSEPINVSGRQIHTPGTIIGKALEPLEKGVGEILVLLSLQ
jgi:hypothetical protein